MFTILDALALMSAFSGAVCLMVWPLFSTRVAMLTVQLGVGVSFCLHYTLLGAETAAVGNAMGAMQILLALLVLNDAKRRWIGYLPIPVMIALAILTWDGWTSLFAMTGTVVLAVGRAQDDAWVLRMLSLLGTALWLLHDILVWSPVAIVDAVSLSIGCFTVVKAYAAATRRAPLRLHPPIAQR